MTYKGHRERDTNKRLKGIGLPIELCVKIERAVGVKAGQTPTYTQRCHVSDAIISALESAFRNIQLTAEDYEQIAEEVKRNEDARNNHD